MSEPMPVCSLLIVVTLRAQLLRLQLNRIVVVSLTIVSLYLILWMFRLSSGATGFASVLCAGFTGRILLIFDADDRPTHRVNRRVE